MPLRSRPDCVSPPPTEVPTYTPRPATHEDPTGSLFRIAVDASPNGMLLVDAEGRIALANRRLQEMFGYTEPELLGQPVEILVPERLRGVHRGDRASFVAAPEARPMGAGRELWGRRSDGSEFPVEIGLNPVRIGEALSILAAVTDITLRREADRILREREERLRILMDNASDAIAVLSPDGTVLEINRTLEKLLGRPRGDLIGRPPDMLPLHGEEEGWTAAFRAAVRNGSGDIRDMRMQTAEGDPAILDFSITVVDVGTDRLVLAIGHDRTQERSLESQLRHSQRMEAVGRLAGGIAHDFNNLLTAILGYAQLASADLAPADPRAAEIAEITRAAERASDLTRQLLAFSRRQVVSPRVFPVNELVATLERMLARLIGEDIRLVIELDETAGNVRADVGQMEQVLVNLAVNARDAMPSGGDLMIRTSAQRFRTARGRLPAGRYVRVEVRDTGTGMTPDVRSRVFEPFFTTKAAGKGTGLGLATVYGIVEQHNGFIDVDSEPARGTRFTILLPSVSAEPAPLPSREGGSAAEGSETILLVEDDDAVRHLSRRFLERRGYRVIEASSPLQALAIVDDLREDVDLLLTDVIMPGMSGRELADRLRELHGLPVLFVSGYTDDAIIHTGVLEAGTHFLAKPFTAEQLATRVREILDDRPTT